MIVKDIYLCTLKTLDLTEKYLYQENSNYNKITNIKKINKKTIVVILKTH